MQNVQLRGAKPGDEAALAYIQTESWKAAFADVISEKTMEEHTRLEKIRQMYEYVLANAVAKGMLLSVDGMPHGMAFWSKARDCSEPDCAELICIHSLQDKWRCGYGSMMMERVIAEMKEQNYQKAILWVFADNIRARKFYEKHGFFLTENHKSSYGAEEVMYCKYL